MEEFLFVDIREHSMTFLPSGVLSGFACEFLKELFFNSEKPLEKIDDCVPNAAKESGIP
jgi:hypothetical protein